MTTVIVVYNSEGVVGRCDAKCHEAKPGSSCDCVCGGAMHACGAANAGEHFQKALDNIREWAKDNPAPDDDPYVVGFQLAMWNGVLI